jgi:hypothetical protein
MLPTNATPTALPLTVLRAAAAEGGANVEPNNE